MKEYKTLMEAVAVEGIVYKPRIVEGRINGTGWPVDGYTLVLSLWDHDDHGDWHLCGWPEEAGQAVMETMFITETAAGMCLYDTLEGFAGHWEEWEPEGSFCIPLDKVEEIRVIQEETKECMNEQDGGGRMIPAALPEGEGL